MPTKIKQKCITAVSQPVGACANSPQEHAQHSPQGRVPLVPSTLLSRASTCYILHTSCWRPLLLLLHIYYHIYSAAAIIQRHLPGSVRRCPSLSTSRPIFRLFVRFEAAIRQDGKKNASSEYNTQNVVVLMPNRGALCILFCLFYIFPKNQGIKA